MEEKWTDVAVYIKQKMDEAYKAGYEAGTKDMKEKMEKEIKIVK